MINCIGKGKEEKVVKILINFFLFLVLTIFESVKNLICWNDLFCENKMYMEMKFIIYSDVENCLYYKQSCL